MIYWLELTAGSNFLWPPPHPLSRRRRCFYLAPKTRQPMRSSSNLRLISTERTGGLPSLPLLLLNRGESSETAQPSGDESSQQMRSAAKSILYVCLCLCSAGENGKIPIRCLRKRKEIHPLPRPQSLELTLTLLNWQNETLDPAPPGRMDGDWWAETFVHYYYGKQAAGQYAVRHKVEETTNKQTKWWALPPESNYQKSGEVGAL